MDKQKIKNTLQLIARSPDCGEGWRSVSETCWPLVATMPPELLELDETNQRCRMTTNGEAVLMFS